MNTVKMPVQVISQRLYVPNMDVFYPIIVRLQNPSVQQLINSSILGLVYALIRQQGYDENPGMQVTGWYELKTNERAILSYNIGNYSYIPHAAHGLTLIKSQTWDTETGMFYRLPDMFKPGSDYVKVISDNIRAQIKERQIPLLQDFGGIRPDQDCYIADKALVIYFQQYEITPYYVGLPMFPISVFTLADIATENGPIGRMATND